MEGLLICVLGLPAPPKFAQQRKSAHMALIPFTDAAKETTQNRQGKLPYSKARQSQGNWQSDIHAGPLGLNSCQFCTVDNGPSEGAVEYSAIELSSEGEPQECRTGASIGAMRRSRQHSFKHLFIFKVILVQVNPGEAFTIRREDGQFQCITANVSYKGDTWGGGRVQSGAPWLPLWIGAIEGTCRCFREPRGAAPDPAPQLEQDHAAASGSCVERPPDPAPGWSAGAAASGSRVQRPLTLLLSWSGASLRSHSPLYSPTAQARVSDPGQPWVFNFCVDTLYEPCLGAFPTLIPRSLSCPAQVPMMSPNGSVPPIYVPPGYAPQVIEDNGVRRVVVVPQAPEFHPGSHAVIHRPPHHPLPGFIPLQAMLPPPPRHIYSTVTGAGDMAAQYIPQYHTSQVYGDLDALSNHGRSNFRDERSSKTYERLQKKLKDRHGTQKDKLNSPPPSPQKCPSPTNEHNGLVTGQDASSVSTGSTKSKSLGKGKSNSQVDAEIEEKDEETKALEALISSITKPVISDIQARTVVLAWSPPSSAINGDTDKNNVPEVYVYEVLISNTGKDGKYKTVYTGEKTSVTINDLRPATDYHARVQAECKCIKGSPSEAESFTTMSCEPDTPNPPRITNRTKNSLTLQWKTSCDNGSKIHNYLLEWDEGKGNGEFCQCYYGQQKQYRITKLSPAMGYTFRLAAKNDMGMSGFSEEVQYHTSGTAPSMPASPMLIKAGVTWLSLQWTKPSGTPTDEGISYILEMEDETSVIAYNLEGKSSPSEVVDFTTCPDKPGVPSKPSVKGKIHAQSFKIIWDPPKDNGGTAITKYVVEISEGLNDEAITGPTHPVPQDDAKAHQELLKRVASNLGLQAEVLEEPSDSVVDVLCSTALASVALTLHEGVSKIINVL
ncbi:Fibronectin type-III domain-containing protein 3a [Chelonia mydas]|uniref:Fibronectin type-III domain-containing protein 3a n=1 Tax=Chelonia mydas TaxID=8469 RepID=M7AW04_CHEMY|nr:Fibronectin type-III domain-containing protein 3a [Chelonia mydas]